MRYPKKGQACEGGDSHSFLTIVVVASAFDAWLFYWDKMLEKKAGDAKEESSSSAGESKAYDDGERTDAAACSWSLERQQQNEMRVTAGEALKALCELKDILEGSINEFRT